MAYAVNDVALKLIELANNETDGLISPLKLQKLLYFSQGWSWMKLGEKLFEEDLEAWAHGPVCPSIYHIYKHYSYNHIPKTDDDIIMDTATSDFLKIIWDAYGHLTGRALESLSHVQTPWLDFYEKGKNNIIPKKAIEDFFHKRYLS